MKRVRPLFFQNLRRSNLRLCRCWRIELEDGTVFGFTEHDKELVIDGETYFPNNSFTSTAFEQSNDLKVDNVNVVALTSDLITEEDLNAGRFDNASVRIFYVQWDRPGIGILPLMGARLGEMTLGEGTFETELRSLSQALQQSIGRVYGLECDANLGDNRCRVDLTPFTATGSISGIFDIVTFRDNSRTEEDDYFQYGMLRFTTGKNAGLEVEVKGYKQEGQMIVLLETPAYPLVVGDEFEIVAGCDKTCDTCRDKFNNIENFRGFPHMPTEQEATETPDWKSGDE